ncbi:MAG: helix-turn-helix domain-containing protein [Proteobacteria bacterium]|nr:helix-turn-helix domain-containing protein [Pseudomonadota bacterium]MBU1547777.1 helix-turn-helix domain-containing protein [Pseudomonadota bacterium]MBU2619695.1 helix-turn-helix domain-containing protein [Pseudomonadota bacterium]
MTTTMDIIRTMYPDRITLSVEELAPLIHMSKTYIRKEVRAGRFLIPWRRIGSRILFPVSAVVTTLDGSDSPPTPRRRGRPTKAESIERERQSSAQE